jgi:hypothetical protein
MGETLDIVLAVCLSSLVAGRSEDVRSTAWYRDLLFFSLSTDNKEEQLVNDLHFRSFTRSMAFVPSIVENSGKW